MSDRIQPVCTTWVPHGSHRAATPCHHSFHGTFLWRVAPSHVGVPAAAAAGSAASCRVFVTPSAAPLTLGHRSSIPEVVASPGKGLPLPAIVAGHRCVSPANNIATCGSAAHGRTYYALRRPLAPVCPSALLRAFLLLHALADNSWRFWRRPRRWRRSRVRLLTGRPNARQPGAARMRSETQPLVGLRPARCTRPHPRRQARERRVAGGMPRGADRAAWPAADAGAGAPPRRPSEDPGRRSAGGGPLALRPASHAPAPAAGAACTRRALSPRRSMHMRHSRRIPAPCPHPTHPTFQPSPSP